MLANWRRVSNLMGVTTTQLEPGGKAGPGLPKLQSFQEKPETTKFKRYLLIFTCWQPIKKIFLNIV